MRKFLIIAVAALLFAAACQRSEENPPAVAPGASAPAAEASGAPATPAASASAEPSPAVAPAAPP